MSFVWTPDAIERLRQGLNDGCTFSQIAALIGHGVTRNACISRAHRSHMMPADKKPAVRRDAAPKAPPPLAPRPVHKHAFAAVNAIRAVKRRARDPGMRQEAAMPPREAPRLQCQPVTIVELRDTHCRWPQGDPVHDFDGFRYCGGAKGVDGPYCEFHRALSITRQFTPAERAANAASRSKRALAPVHQRT